MAEPHSILLPVLYRPLFPALLLPTILLLAPPFFKQGATHASAGGFESVTDFDMEADAAVDEMKSLAQR
jgi:hypothetical protein